MLAFDTHAYVKSLEAVGFTEEQAEVQANALKTLVENDLATKRDLKELELTTKRDLKELENSLKRDMKELELGLKHDLTLRLGGMLVVGISVVATLVKLL
ncbi:MAG: hypothetical protein HQM14_17660 [SAR324 cluster bacterium]|nr:hypothetical protein [SAR324 cluster bacterium]